MPANTEPIFSKIADIQWLSALLSSAMTAGNVSAYNGTDANAALLFTADSTNGGFLFKIRAKCCALTGTSAASVLRIFLNNGSTPGTAANNALIGEISLPACTVSATAPLPDIEYTVNMPIPPGYRVYVGLGTTVTSGWMVTAIGGKY